MMAKNNTIETPNLIPENVAYEKQIEGIRVISIIPKKLDGSDKNFDDFVTALNKAVQPKLKGGLV